jgi:hypothetical protein
VIKLLIQLREEDMNTIQINTAEGTVNYTEAEVIRFIERTKDIDAVQQRADQYRKDVIDIRNEVRDFFSEGEWNDGETTCNKGDVNAMLERIGANKLTTKYTGTFTINGTFSIEAEDIQEAADVFENDVNVEFYGGDIEVDEIETHDLEEDN